MIHIFKHHPFFHHLLPTFSSIVLGVFGFFESIHLLLHPFCRFYLSWVLHVYRSKHTFWVIFQVNLFLALPKPKTRVELIFFFFFSHDTGWTSTGYFFPCWQKGVWFLLQIVKLFVALKGGKGEGGGDSLPIPKVFLQCANKTNFKTTHFHENFM